MALSGEHCFSSTESCSPLLPSTWWQKWSGSLCGSWTALFSASPGDERIFMSTPIDNLFGQGSRPIRRKRVAHDAFDEFGNLIIVPERDKIAALSREGSIDDLTIRHFLDCGHPAEQPLGGRCCEPGCGKVSCMACYKRCANPNCNKGLCLEHVRTVESANGQPIPVCSSCRSLLKRKRFWGNIAKIALSPFVAFEKSKESDGKGGENRS